MNRLRAPGRGQFDAVEHAQATLDTLSTRSFESRGRVVIGEGHQLNARIRHPIDQLDGRE